MSFKNIFFILQFFLCTVKYFSCTLVCTSAHREDHCFRYYFFPTNTIPSNIAQASYFLASFIMHFLSTWYILYLTEDKNLMINEGCQFYKIIKFMYACTSIKKFEFARRISYFILSFSVNCMCLNKLYTIFSHIYLKHFFSRKLRFYVII